MGEEQEDVEGPKANLEKAMLDTQLLRWPARAPSQRSSDFGGGLCELAVLEAIEEYCSFHGLEEASKALQDQLTARGLRPLDAEGGVPFEHTPVQGEFAVAQALAHFDEGWKGPLFELMGRLIPAEEARSPASSALELRLRVHFCTHAFRKSQPAEGEAEPPDFEDLKAFLAAHPAAALDESSESLAPLFALPFVPRPQTNPGLKYIFEDAWVGKLRTDLHALLVSHAAARHVPSLRHVAGSILSAKFGPRSAPPPASWQELVRIADQGLAIASSSRSHSRGPGVTPVAKPALGPVPNLDLLKEIGDARRRLADVHAKPEEPPLAPLAPLLSEFGPDDVSVNPPICHDRLWPMSREQALRASTAPSMDASRSPMAKRVHSARSLESRARTATALLPVPPALDFGRIAAVIAGEKEEAVIGTGRLAQGAEDAEGAEAEAEAEAEPAPSLHSILRAVLRRLALPDEPIRPRRAFLAAFSCFGALRALAGRLGEVVGGGDAELTELMLAVLAVCSCEVVGRREIEGSEAEVTAGDQQPEASCIEALVVVLKREPALTLTHMQCLAVLQRLSLRGQLQSMMIELGVIDWILNNLRLVARQEGPWANTAGGDVLGAFDFSIEFLSALLMNLTLRSAGRKRCSALGAYSVLVDLVEHPNTQVRTHVNGTLYTLLGMSSIRAEAVRLGAEVVFRDVLARAPQGDDLVRRQLEYLLGQLGRDPADDEGAEDAEVESTVGVQDDADDGDNFLDEEELAGHFLLRPAGAGPGANPASDGSEPNASGSQPPADPSAIAAAAAEEALRRFRVTPEVADVQQRRFHAFIARSCRGLISPKKRYSSLGDAQSPLPLPRQDSVISAMMSPSLRYTPALLETPEPGEMSRSPSERPAPGTEMSPRDEEEEDDEMHTPREHGPAPAPAALAAAPLLPSPAEARGVAPAKAAVPAAAPAPVAPAARTPSDPARGHGGADRSSPSKPPRGAPGRGPEAGKRGREAPGAASGSSGGDAGAARPAGGAKPPGGGQGAKRAAPPAPQAPGAPPRAPQSVLPPMAKAAPPAPAAQSSSMRSRSEAPSRPPAKSQERGARAGSVPAAEAAAAVMEGVMAVGDSGQRWKERKAGRRVGAAAAAGDDSPRNPPARGSSVAKGAPTNSQPSLPRIAA